ncbi:MULTISPECIES: hypothetical protein [Legionella]|uniref:Uncharacterized protein n=1 Tax=Legionella steelei TaxID=947033 RepID=A0A0W0ZNT7_9GAMM|nr:MULTISPECIES: hypothetical protein [Legionella]KTD70435.1 hypothetical protein Lste_0586 [Legionella steelei]
MGWMQGPEETSPKQVVLVDTHEINPYYKDALDGEGDESVFFDTIHASESLPNQDPGLFPTPTGQEQSYSTTKLTMFNSCLLSETVNSDSPLSQLLFNPTKPQ